jgi:hypothetical protein
VPVLGSVVFSPLIAHPEQFHLYHLRRSGGHGVIDWLLKHQPGNKVHYNQAIPLCPGSFQVAEEQIVRIPGARDKPLFELISFEDLPLNFVANKVHPSRHAVLMLRDPFNTFASRMRTIENHRAHDVRGFAKVNRIVPALWKQYAHEFLHPRHLPHAVRLNFNAWYASVSYRRQISEQLGWAFTDDGFASTAGWRFSCGSSFGDRDPKSLDLLNRWQAYRDHAEFLAYCDDEIRQLSLEIFQFAPPLPR